MITLSDLATVAFTFVFSAFFENALHKASHYPSSGRLYRWHKIHHKDYPAKRVESDTYIDSSNRLDNGYARYILGTQFCLGLILPTRTFLIFWIQSSSYALFLEHMHQQFHIKQSPWLQYKWFRRLKKDHLRHHVKLRTNYSFFMPIVDQLQNTYETVGPTD